MIYRRVDVEDAESYWVEAPEIDCLDFVRNDLSWPSCDESSLIGWVYTLYGANDAPLYVGTSNNPSTRVKDHRRKPWWHEVQRVGLQVVPERDRFHLERLRIEELQPLYNRMWVTCTPGEHVRQRVAARKLASAAA
ncbi:MAG TPA: GIY-YIG nuclease family protein [Propionibacteriaceae bacterium]